MNAHFLDDDDTEIPANASGNPKLQRWIDILAALLSRNGVVTFTELATDVPEYAAKLREAQVTTDVHARERTMGALKRAFERDKAELRTLGVPIESLEDSEGNEGGAYRLRRRDFYLPYLALHVNGARTQPKKVTAYGYRELTTLTFEADELQAIVDAALLLRALGEPLLTSHANSALRKLAFDLPVGAVEPSNADPRVLRSRAQESLDVFEALSDALHRRKVATFSYDNFSKGDTETREVEPYGVFFLHGNWYLVARNRNRDDLRNFRLSRISNVNVNAKKAQSPDYDIPNTFKLREHASSRHAWELGDEPAVQVTARFTGTSGPTVAASKLGTPVSGDSASRVFNVRRMDTFVRWMLSFAGEVVPVSPPEVVSRYRSVIEQLRAMYARPVSERDVPAPSKPIDNTHASREWQPAGAAAQFNRLLHVIPQIADGNEHQLAEVAERAGMDVRVLHTDLFSLVLRYDVPGGFVEGVQLLVSADSVEAVSNHLQRPMRLTTPELRALELGLAVLRNHRTPTEQPAVDTARERIVELLAKLPNDAISGGVHDALLASHVDSDVLALVRQSITGKRQLQIAYRKSGAADVNERVVCPYALVAASGMLYVLAYCTREQSLRVFRLDRVEGAVVLEDAFEIPEEFALEEVLEANRAMMQGEYAVMTVRYSPRIARWIAEREGMVLEADGSLVLEHPVADESWAVRHVLQYGVEAEVVWPVGVRGLAAARIKDVCRPADAISQNSQASDQVMTKY